MNLKRCIDKDIDAVLAELKVNARKIANNDEIAQVGTISAIGNAEIGRFLTEAMQKVGNEGVIPVEEGKTAETELEAVEGMQSDRGDFTLYFITNQDKMRVELEEAYVLLNEKKLSASLAPVAGGSGFSPASCCYHCRGNRTRGACPAAIQAARWSRHCRRRSPGLRRPSQGNTRGYSDPDWRRRHQRNLGIKLENVTLAMRRRARKVWIEEENTMIFDGAGARKPEFGYGWNAQTSEFGDLFNQGVIDPARFLQSQR
ncbi:hypothetical protein X736_31235 [Mesorhizobium sp. L2C089B000]|nr:hypothetical protein X736_31235 [Mesorhizobium sp. L2C089B000]